MDELLKSVFTAPLATLFIVAGTIFLLIAVVGNISGKIEPGTTARIISGIVGLSFVLVGLRMHLVESEPGKPPSDVREAQSSKSSQTPIDGTLPENEGSPGIHTKYGGVIAYLTGFEKTGSLITVELTIKNSSDEEYYLCSNSKNAQLIDEATGKSWEPIHYGGAYSGCEYLSPDHNGGMWMSFKVPDAEKRVFSFSSPLLNGLWKKLAL